MSEMKGAHVPSRLFRRMLAVSLFASGLVTCPTWVIAQRPTIATHVSDDGSRVADELLSRKITLNLAQISLKRAIDSIARVSHVFIQYRAPMLTVYTTPITLGVNAEPLGTVLERVLSGTALRAVPDGPNKITIEEMLESSRDSVPGAGMISGRVIDSTTGRGLSGVTIKVAGTRISAITQDSGRFTLKDVGSGQQVLTSKLFGYRPSETVVEVTAAQTTSARIRLVPAPTVLSGVITTATGTQRKVEVGNDITTLNADSIMRVAPVQSVTDLLETRVPGLTIQHTSGVPGSPSRVRVRGASSIIGNNDPIVIVDGVRVYASQSDPRNHNMAGLTSGLGGDTPAPSPLDQIDPNSIETIEVLKGPSASALYGSDAAQGVIVIKTKHGISGPTQWNLSMGAGIDYTPGDWPVNYYRFGTDTVLTGFGSSYPVCDWNDPNCRLDSLVAFQALNDARYSPFNHGSHQTGALSFSGGSSTLLYSISGSAAGNVGLLELPKIERTRYEAQYGPLPNYLRRPDNYQTWGVTGQMTAQPRSTMRVTLQGIVFDSHQQQGSLQGAVGQLMGEYIDATQLGIAPLIQNDVQKVTDHQLTTTNAMTVLWQPLSWLPITATGGMSIVQRTDESVIPFGINSAGPGTTVADTDGYYAAGHGESQVNTLTMGTSFPVVGNRVTIAAGGNYVSQSTSDETQVVNVLSPGVNEPPGCPSNAPVYTCGFTNATNNGATYGWYIEPRLNVHSQFFVSPGFRLDGGSASGTHGGFAGSGLTGFPKIDFSWVAVDQDRPRGWISLLRPRMAVGVAGTQPGSTEKLRLFNATLSTSGAGTPGGVDQNLCGNNTCNASGFLNGVEVPLTTLSSLGNTHLRPETSRELEGGFDVELWHGRVAVTWTQYMKRRDNAILSIPVAPSVAGVNQNIETNIGVIRNVGTEMTFNTTLLERRAISWTVGGNLSQNNSLVVRLNPGQPTIQLQNNERIAAGYPLFARFERPIVGFSDMNHDGIIERDEVAVGDSAVYVGQEVPKYQFNASTGVALLNGRLSVNATFAYQNGMTQYNGGALASGAYNSIANMPGTTLATQAALAASLSGASQIGLIQTVNTFRFNDLSVNYVLPTAFAQWMRVPRATIAVQGSNLALHTNYRGKDPNVNAFSTVSSADETADLGQIPEPRTWWIKLSLGN